MFRYLLSLVVLLVGCEGVSVPLTPCPTPTATPEPTPTPVSTPRQLSVFIVPEEAPVNSPVPVVLCEPYKPNTELWADMRFKLGTFGENKASNCMELIVRFNTPGVRLLTVGEHKAEIFVGKP